MSTLIMKMFPLLCICIEVALSTLSPAADWQPAKGPLMTRWAKDVSPEKVLPEYPRPQMVRGEKSWTNLNGLWDYAIRDKDAGRPENEEAWQGQILVPFCVESALSGVGKTVGPDKRLWYCRWVSRDEIKGAGRLLLHFGACDWETVVYVNGIKAGEHRGGYDPFTIDITEQFATTKNVRDEIVVSVWDPTDAGHQPRGKQVQRPGGIFYTSVTGIWQTVWLERVPKTHIRLLKIVPDLDNKTVVITADIASPEEGVVLFAEAHAENDTDAHGLIETGDANRIVLDMEEALLWSPDEPTLYDLKLSLRRKKDDSTVDAIASYFGMRKIEVKKDVEGFNRLFLNNEPLFQYGPLDQGWWPDGLYTAPTDEALKWDIEMTKKLGFNMCRKHVKVEPARWYYWCDKLGLLVWQDMPNGDRHIGGADPDIERSAESEATYRREWQAIVSATRNHPSIVAWVPFNEGWGQFKTNEILHWTKDLDPTRIVDGPSGWTDRGGGEMHDMHAYPGPSMFAPTKDRASVLGEFGGLGLPLEGHLWQQKDNWGYRTYKTKEELLTNYELLIHKLRPLIGKGLAAAVYTQTTDVEGEVNGLITYDREVVKLDAERLAALHKKLYEPPPIVEINTLSPTSEHEAQTWRFMTAQPADGWNKPDFDDAKWDEGPGGFGERSTPGTHVRTEWKTPDIWLRRTFNLSELPAGEVQLRMHHDEDAEIYINGVLAAKVEGYVVDYFELPISAAAKAALKAGKNTIAVRCHQTGGGQYIDVGVVDVVEKPR
jgi:hypothetical protein